MHAHPDDETLVTGGLIARCADAGVSTHLVTCTDGRLGPVSPELGISPTRAALARLRERELRDAAAILGVAGISWLGYHDSGMASPIRPTRQSFCGTDIEEPIDRLVGIIRRVRPHLVVTYDACGGTTHPDHVRAHRATMLAVAAADEPSYAPATGPPWRVGAVLFPVFPEHAMVAFIAEEIAAGRDNPFGRPTSEINYVRDNALVTHRVAIAAVWRRKADALAAFRTQVGSHNPQLAAGGLARRDFEHFRLAAGSGDVTAFADVLEPVLR